MHVHLNVFVGAAEAWRVGVDESNGTGGLNDYLEALVPIQGGVPEVSCP